MKVVTRELASDITTLNIMTLADQHIGEKNCDTKLVEKQIEEIKSNPNTYVILNGDLMNNATKTGKSDIYSEMLSPMAQVERAISLLEPIKDRIISADAGNHELRTYINDGIDIMSFVALELGFADCYSMEGNVIFLRFGLNNKDRKVCYSLYHIHGEGGGIKIGSKVNKLSELSAVIDVDCYIHSHTHAPVLFRESYYRTDPRNSTIALVDRLYVNTGSSLKYGGYGQRKGYRPSSTRTPIIHLNGRTKEATATL